MEIRYTIRGHESDEVIEGVATHTAESCRRWFAAQAARGMRVEARDARGRMIARARLSGDGSVDVRVRARAFRAAEREELAGSFASASWILSAICFIAAVAI